VTGGRHHHIAPRAYTRSSTVRYCPCGAGEGLLHPLSSPVVFTRQLSRCAADVLSSRPPGPFFSSVLNNGNLGGCGCRSCHWFYIGPASLRKVQPFSSRCDAERASS
jgi:hypothetical protein